MNRAGFVEEINLKYIVNMKMGFDFEAHFFYFSRFYAGELLFSLISFFLLKNPIILFHIACALILY